MDFACNACSMAWISSCIWHCMHHFLSMQACMDHAKHSSMQHGMDPSCSMDLATHALHAALCGSCQVIKHAGWISPVAWISQCMLCMQHAGSCQVIKRAFPLVFGIGSQAQPHVCKHSAPRALRLVPASIAGMLCTTPSATTQRQAMRRASPAPLALTCSAAGQAW